MRAGLDVYAWLRPLFFRLAPETAHWVAIRSLRVLQHLPISLSIETTEPILRQQIWGLNFPNPIGLAAGFDKDAEVWRAALGLGFGFVEVGSVTPLPQSGNPKPRLFRLTESEAILNRMGFNNAGMATVAARLAKDGRGRPDRKGVLGVNLGKNKVAVDAASDYEAGIKALARYADYLVINISSPNTPGLRALQGREPLQGLIDRARRALDDLHLSRRPALLLKIAPDLTLDDLSDIASVALEGKLDGLIVSNTTITRPANIESRWSSEAGGLSGKPLFALSTEILREVFRLTGGKLPLIGTGGVSNGAEAYAKIRAGASLVQLYTALVYHGPNLVQRINHDLASLLRRDGFANVRDAVGADHH